MTDFVPQETPFTGRKMALIIVAFFGIIIAVNGTMLTLAVNTFGGLVVGNSYVASQNFNEDVAAARAQPIHGWLLDVRAEGDSLLATVRDRDGTALTGLTLSLIVGRPTHDRSTIHVALTEAEPGIYTAMAAIEPGRWRGTLTTSDGQSRGFAFEREGRAR